MSEPEIRYPTFEIRDRERGGLGAENGRDLLDLERLDDVSDLDVLVLLEPDAALEALLDLRHVVLEAAERSDLAFVDHAVVPQQADLGAPGDRALGDVAAGHDAELRHLERVAHLGAAASDLL